MSVIHRAEAKSWHLTLYTIGFRLPRPKKLLFTGVAMLAAGGLFSLDSLFLSFAYIHYAFGVISFGMLAAGLVCRHVYRAYRPITAHGLWQSIWPKALIVEQGRITGLETYEGVGCSHCGKDFKELRAVGYEFGAIIKRAVYIISVYDRYGRRDITDHGGFVANLLRCYGVELIEEETLMFHRFYTLEYDRARRAVVVYRPPKELETLIDARSALQVVDFGARGDENIMVLLIAFKIRFMFDKRVVSTCLLGIMKSGHVWLNQTPHTLPPRLDDHLAWSMGLNRGEEVVEADRSGIVWRPRLSRRHFASQSYDKQ